MVNDIILVIISVGKAQIFVIALIILSYIIEKVTILNLFIDHYTWRKSPNNVQILANGDTGYYVILCIFVLSYDIFKGFVKFNVVSILSWLFLMMILIPTLRHLHLKYQGVDPDKPDDDWTSDLD